MQKIFEDAAWQLHVERCAKRGESPGTRDDLFWKQADGSYGVLMFNAAWWGWQAAVEVLSDA
jgi:hypothetical protein